MANFYLLALANFFFFLANSFFHLFPIYMGEIGASTTYIGLVMGLTSAMAVVLTWAFRNKIDFINKQKFLFYAGLGGLLVYLGYYVRADLYTIPALRLLQGVFYSVGFTFGAALAVDLIPKHRRAGLIGLFGISGALTNAVGPFVAERLLVRFEFDVLFLAAALSMVVSVGCLYFIRCAAHKPTMEESLPAVFSEYRKIVALPLLLGMIFQTFFSFISHYSRSLEIEPVSFFYLGYTLILMMVRVSLNKKLNTWRSSTTIPVTLMAGIIALLLASGLTAYPIAYILMLVGALLGITHGILYPTLTVLFLEATPRRPGKATLMFILCFNLGGMVASFVNGYVADLVGYRWMYLISAGVAGLFFVIFYNAREVRRLSAKPVPEKSIEELPL